MPQDWYSDQVARFKNYFGSPLPGLPGGSSQFNRATEDRGIIKVIRFSINLAAPNNPPGLSGASIGSGDTLIIAELKYPDRIFFGRVYEVATWGAGVTLSFGKRDGNNAANTDPAHYLAASSFAAAAGTSYDFNLNMGEQVGVDALGDLTVGNLLPSFGGAPVWVTATVGGAVPNSTGGLNGYILIAEEGN